MTTRVKLPCFLPVADRLDLARERLERLLGLAPPQAQRAIAETFDCFRQEVDEFDLVLDISDYADLLIEGDNLLAIHALNGSPTSTDFLISVVLDGAVDVFCVAILSS